MVTPRQRPWLAAVALLIALPLPTVPTPALGAMGTGAFVHTPSPRPGALVAAGATELRARLWTAAEIERVELSLDGVPLTGFTVGPADPVLGSELSAALDLTPGAHVAHLAFTDADGGHSERTWTFTATDRSTRRLAGADRVGTAAALSSATFPAAGAAAAAVVTRADDFADALTGVPLAASVGGPLLLAHRDHLPAATAAELRRAVAAGSTVRILGGPAALSDRVVAAVEDLGFRALRHHGPDRFATAAAVAAHLPPSSATVLASGASFADALAVSAPAARDGLPILLTAADHLPEATVAALMERDPSSVTIVGGTVAVGAGVQQRIGQLVPQVRRLAGEHRYATAAAVLDAYYHSPSAVSLASGAGFADALAGGRHAAAFGQPLLLAEREALPRATEEALRANTPERVDLYGGPAALGERVLRAALHAAEDGADAPRVQATRPADASSVTALPEVTVEFDRAVDPSGSSVHVQVGGSEVRGQTEPTGPATLTWRASAGQPTPAADVAHQLSVVVHARAADGLAGAHHEAELTYLDPDLPFATAGPVALRLPSAEVELVAFHEANHDGAQQQHPRDTPTPKLTMPSRRRGTGSRSAADVVAAPGREVIAPVSGRVVRAGSYLLYCRHSDHYAVIEPDSRPGWEVKVLHFHGLRVTPDDVVIAGQTVLGDGPRQLPFRSQVDDHSDPRDWPHLHVEVVDPSLPTMPGEGC